MLDQHDFFFPGQQALFEFDHSSGHLKKGEDSLTTGKMSVRFGGKQKAPRNTVLTDFCIGSSPAVLWRNPGNKHQWSNVKVDSWEEVDCRLKSGDTLRHTAGPDDPPPHYQVEAPREDAIKTVVDQKRTSLRMLLLKVGLERLSARYSNPTPRYGTLNAPPRSGTNPAPKSQAVWLRGLWLDGMTDKGNLAVDDLEESDDAPEDGHDFPVVVPGRTRDNWKKRMDNAQSTLSLFKVLQCCEDFANEPSILQDVIQQRGHLCRFCVK